MDPSETRLATGSTDAELRLYAINAEGEAERGGAPPGDADAAGGEQQQDGGRSRGSDFLVPMGSVRRQTHERAETVRWAAVPGARGGVLLTCQSAGKVTEVYRLRSAAEAAKKMKRRRKRRREKQEKKAAGKEGGAEDGALAAEVRRRAGAVGLEGGHKRGRAATAHAWRWQVLLSMLPASSDTAALLHAVSPLVAACHNPLVGRHACRPPQPLTSPTQEEDHIQASDELELLAAIRSKHKARSFAVCPPGAAGRRAGAGGHVASLVLSLTNNSLELWDVSEGGAAAAEDAEGEGAAAHKAAAASGASGAAEKAQTLDLAGHRSDVRAVALASDDSLALSASNNCVKVREGAGCRWLGRAVRQRIFWADHLDRFQQRQLRPYLPCWPAA